MRDLWILNLQRAEVLQLLGSRRVARGAIIRLGQRSDLAVAKETVTFVWAHPPNDLDGLKPSLAVVPAGETADFLAWATTYIDTLRPFTAFVRVIEPADV